MSEVTDIQTVKILERIAVSLEARVVAPTKDMTDLVDHLQAEIDRKAARHREQLAEGGAVNARLTEERDAAWREIGELKARLSDVANWHRDPDDGVGVALLTEERDAAWRAVTALQEQIARTTEERDVLRAEVAVHRAASAEANDALRANAELRKRVAELEQNIYLGLIPPPLECKRPHCNCETWAPWVGMAGDGHHPHCSFAPPAPPEKK